ncbi:L,D-transpeptidase family protein [Azorhizobium doebereinerae]|uniref:L,D-transpeptidase family protein n=1 Tax=Azorhizobium doebereinerae TaxID=281091 RepID=UPI00048FB71E|nr:L,D-transpeptidase family protein [Azorhizobium doebereinerae]
MTRQLPVGISKIAVRRLPGGRHRGVLSVAGRTLAVALGRGGIGFDKREGDGRTPAGVWHPVRVLYRADRVARPLTRLPVAAIRPADGWCDDPQDRRYNRPVALPFPASHERLWRDDGLYDLLLVIDHNTRPRVKGRGSAVFIHLARPGYRPTEGCVALKPADLRRLLTGLGPGTRIIIS